MIPSDYFNVESKPIHALALPEQNNDKLKKDYPILNKWL